VADKKQLIETVAVLGALVRNIALKRALHNADANPHLNFWRLIYGNQMDMAVLEWCKLFGSDDAERQPVHWKNVAVDQAAFRAGLFTAVGMDEAQWARYWREMKTYRDYTVAHHDPRRESIPTFPVLDPALNGAIYYFEYVRAELAKLGVNQQPSNVRLYVEQFEEQCLAVAKAALAATRDIPETVM
jgi:hypothetical protein